MKFVIEGKDYEAMKLTVGQLTTVLGDKVKEELMKDAIKMGSLMKNPLDKSKFLRDAYTTLPSGGELMKAAEEYLQSINGYQWIIEKSTGEEVELNEDNIESFVSIIEFALGVESIKEDVNKKEVDKENDPLTKSPVVDS
jgi:hypothetical protein